MKIWFNESSALALREVSTALRCVLKNEEWHRLKNEELHMSLVLTGTRCRREYCQKADNTRR
jgi:hypothetical protein